MEVLQRTAVKEDFETLGFLLGREFVDGNRGEFFQESATQFYVVFGVDGNFAGVGRLLVSSGNGVYCKVDCNVHAVNIDKEAVVVHLYMYAVPFVFADRSHSFRSLYAYAVADRKTDKRHGTECDDGISRCLPVEVGVKILQIASENYVGRLGGANSLKTAFVVPFCCHKVHAVYSISCVGIASGLLLFKDFYGLA